MGIGKQLHLILLMAVAVSSLVPPQCVPILAAASPVPYGGHVTNWTAPPTLAVTAIEVGLAATAEEFLMESEISQEVLSLNFLSVTRPTGKSGSPAVTCDVTGYRRCLPKANGQTPKHCDDPTRRECPA
ncbi:hypothetical protein MLD38_034725 [Melastoma candidum]|uniref:Uncharacterized protein n=1 Tax=Melastoma candidum TaxID=119954 RepID=A0ACB9MAK3_9MYRT|nr:hypothetical protein MLD38_034725 [Melastoma candidum]